MQQVGFFTQFMNDEVNLNPARIKILNQKRTTIQTFIQNSDSFKDMYIDMFSQGSYKHKTIIKPPKANKEFDADILLHLEPSEAWEYNPKMYINELFNIFKTTDRYKDIVIKNTRCITLNYVGNFHVDIVPIVKRKGHFYIINKYDNMFEKTNPIEYINWLISKNQDSNYQLRKVIRLFKYIRDIKQTFTAKSILLNTMLANQVYQTDSAEKYINLPTSFKLIINRLNDFLQANYFMPNIHNPKMPEENFMRNWTQEQYLNFRKIIFSYTEKTNDAYNEEDKKKSIKKWKSVFGSKFPEFTRSTKLEASNENYSSEEEFITDIVDSVSLDYKLKINCMVKGQNGIRDMLLNMVPILRAEKKLEFFIESLDSDITIGYEIYWKVKNEGNEAKKANKLRGSIFKGKKSHIEPTKYKGRHYVECYLIKDRILIATDRIDVPIEIG
ncbi:nucleotide-binding domain-containing protein [Sulfurimonas sp.]|uniref:nucleotide-binding domain-containing protein n=1 Tax=Sulfurimonas sp. TaxID=2022749 RepID=UPI002AB1E05C|nr:hypothetical protein [Sulfurimonas sp.]